MEKDCVVSYQKIHLGVPSEDQMYGTFTKQKAVAWLASKGFEAHDKIWLRSEGTFTMGVAKILQIKAP